METITQLFESVKQSQIFLLTLTVVLFYGAQLLQRRFKSPLLHPILISTALVIVTLSLAGVEYEKYYAANSPINFLLSLSVVCLGYLMYKNFKPIREYKITILISTFVGSIVGLLSIVGLSYLFGCDEIVMISMEPKSITTAIALSLSDIAGGIPALTSLAVVVAGISGSIFGPMILKLFRIDDPVARGLAMGSASHAVGTARALEIMGAVEGAVGGAAIGIMGLFTSLLLPIVNALLGIG